MIVKKIKTYTYKELDDLAKVDVKFWLDQNPIDYEREDGTIVIEYFSDMDEWSVNEHCELNDYFFTKKGQPIHNIVVQNKYVGQGRRERQVVNNNKIMLVSFIGFLACVIYLILTR